MRVSVDISLYPLTEQFVEPILAFIKKLEDNPKLNISRNNLSTQIFGEYREAVFEQLPHSVFVLKMIGNDRYHVED